MIKSARFHFGTPCESDHRVAPRVTPIGYDPATDRFAFVTARNPFPWRDALAWSLIAGLAAFLFLAFGSGAHAAKIITIRHDGAIFACTTGVDCDSHYVGYSPSVTSATPSIIGHGTGNASRCLDGYAALAAQPLPHNAEELRAWNARAARALQDCQ